VVSLNLKRHQEDKVFLMKRCKSFHLQKLLKKNFFFVRHSLPIKHAKRFLTSC